MSKSGSAGSSSQAKGAANSLKLGLAASQIRPNPATGFARSLFAVRGPSQWANLLRVVETVHRQHQPELFSSSVLGRHQNFQLDAGVVNRSLYVPRPPQTAPAAPSEGVSDYDWSEADSDTASFPASAPSYLNEVIASPATSQEATPLQRASVRATYPAGMPTAEAADWAAPAMTVLNRQVAAETPAAAPVPQQSQSDPFWNDLLPQEVAPVGNAPVQTSQWIEQLPALRHNPAISPEVSSVAQQFQPVSESALNQSYLSPEYVQPRPATIQPVASAEPLAELPRAVSMPAPFVANQEPAAAQSNSSSTIETDTPVFTQPALVRAVARATNTAEQVETGYGQLPAQPTTAMAMSHLPLNHMASSNAATSGTLNRQATSDYSYAASPVEANPTLEPPMAYQDATNLVNPATTSSVEANSQTNVNSANPLLNRVAEPVSFTGESAQVSGQSLSALDRVTARAANSVPETVIPVALDRVVARAANNNAEIEPGYGQLPAQPSTAMAMSHLPLARAIEQAKVTATPETTLNNRAETTTFADGSYNSAPTSSQPANFEPATALTQPSAGEQTNVPAALDRVAARAANAVEQNDSAFGQTLDQSATAMAMSHLPLARPSETVSSAGNSSAAGGQARLEQAETATDFTSTSITSSEGAYNASQMANSSYPGEELAIPAALNRVAARAANAVEPASDRSPATLAMSHLPVNTRSANNAATATSQPTTRVEEGFTNQDSSGLDAALQIEQGSFTPALPSATEQALSRSALERANARANYYINPEQSSATAATPAMSDLQRTVGGAIAEQSGVSQTAEAAYIQDNNGTYSVAPEVGSAQPASLAPAQMQEPRGTDLERWVAELAARYTGTEAVQPAPGLYDEVGGGSADDFAAVQRSYYTVTPSAEATGKPGSPATSSFNPEASRGSDSEFGGSDTYSSAELAGTPLSPLARVAAQLNQPTLVHALNQQSNAALGRAIERLNDESGIGAAPAQTFNGAGPVETDVTLPDMTYSMPPLMAVQAASSVDFPAPQTNDLLSLSLQSGLSSTSARPELSPEAESRINSAFEGLPSTGPISDSRFNDKRAGAWADRLNALRYNPGKDMPSPDEMPAQALAALIASHLNPANGISEAGNRAGGRPSTTNTGELARPIDPELAGGVEPSSNGSELNRLAMTQLDTQNTARSNSENNEGTPNQTVLNSASGQLGQGFGVTEPALGTSTAASFVQPMLQRHAATGAAAAENTLNHPKPISVEKTGVKVADQDTLLRESQGRQLDSQVRAIMSDLLQANFDNVQVHDDSAAAKYADEIGAEAFTVGNSHIFFAAQRYQPHRPESMGLIAHELTHILQGASLTKLNGGAMPDVDHTGHAHELEAQQTEQAVMRHLETSEHSHDSGSSSSGGSSSLQRTFMPLAVPNMSHPDMKGITGKDEVQRQGTSNTHGSQHTETSGGNHDNHNGGAGHDGKENNGDAKKTDLDTLAREVYRLIRYQLIVERERHGLRDLFS